MSADLDRIAEEVHELVFDVAMNGHAERVYEDGSTLKIDYRTTPPTIELIIARRGDSE